MGMKSEPFSGVVLSGSDVQKFTTQVRTHRPGKVAVATVSRGKKLAVEFNKKGYVTLTCKPRETRVKAG